jgi:dephospho-CoA kinase
MIKVGLTGNHESGHRKIAKEFENLLVPVFDADLMFKFLINYDNPTTSLISRKFGDNIYKFGLLDMRHFESNKKFEELWNLIKPKMKVIWNNWTQSYWNKPYTIFLSSILYEVGLNENCNNVINVFKSEASRREYLVRTTRMPVSVIDNLLKGELSENYKSKKADFVINNSKPEFAKKEILSIHDKILRESSWKKVDLEII